MIFSIQLVQLFVKREVVKSRKRFLFNNKSKCLRVLSNVTDLIFRVERATRYNEKVKSGVIGPFVPEWQRLKQEKEEEAKKRLLEKEQRKLEFERKKQERKLEFERKQQELLFKQELKKIERELIIEGHLEGNLPKPQLPPKWILLYTNNSIDGNPYQRVFKPRHTKIGERIEQNCISSK